MSNLRKYTLHHNEKNDKWQLENDESGKVRKNFNTKEEATKGGVLEDILGSGGGSVKIQKKDGKYQEERTYPRSKDPRQSKG